jgi:long-chain acyl-CoA synthetase
VLLPKLGDLINVMLKLAPAEPFIEFEGAWYSWGEFAAAMAAIDALLSWAQVPAEGRIGILLRNRPELVSAILSTVARECCLVTLNTIGSEEKLAAEVERSEVTVVIGASSEWSRSRIREAAAGLGALGIEVSSSGGKITTSVVLQAVQERWKRATSHGVAVEMLSSGTTGTPKRIPLARSTFTHSVLDYLSFEKKGVGAAPRLRSGVQFLTAPFGHVGGLGRLLMAVVTGRKAVLFERFEGEAFRCAIVRHRPKVVSGPPTVLRMLLDANTPREDLSSLVAFRCGMAPLDPDLADEFTTRYGVAVLQNYGATEFGGGIAGWTMEDYKAHRLDKRGSVGRLSKGVEARLVDTESGQPLPVGSVGLLEIRADHIQDGRWVRTTDLALVDADQFVWIKGRADNAIIRGGFKILPDEVASVIGAHPAVSEASVVGIPDARLGHVPVAALVLKPGQSEPAPKEFESFLRERLNSYQIPAQLKFVDSLPKLETLKVNTAAVRKLFVE